jgi:hypothetical protein
LLGAKFGIKVSAPVELLKEIGALPSVTDLLALFLPENALS